MGVYQYTIRSETKTIDGVEIGRYGFAYKESTALRNYPGGNGQRVRRAEASASTAAEKNRAVRHFIVADSFAEACGDGYSVHEIDRDPPMSVADTLPRSKVVGVIRKESGRFVFRRAAQ